MQPAPEKQPNPPATSPASTCSSCRRWVGVVADLALELHGLRELVHEDEVELVASRLESLHRLLGGEDVPAGRHRALARQILSEAQG